MKIYHKNPRQITKQQYQDLEAWLEELGDLSGIVHDLNSDEIPAGNQRSHIFGLIKDEGNIVITEQLDEPTPQGTIARGYVEWRGERFGYRQVQWTPEQCEKANIIANKAGGQFDYDILANEFDLDSLLEWGFESWELGGIESEVDYNELWKGMPEFENSPKAIRSIRIHFENQADIDEFSKLIEQNITEKTRSIWYPKREKDDLRSLRFHHES